MENTYGLYIHVTVVLVLLLGRELLPLVSSLSMQVMNENPFGVYLLMNSDFSHVISKYHLFHNSHPETYNINN